jgi:sarcosine oxidase, subunit gamma
MRDARIRVQSWDATPSISAALEAAVATRWPRVPGQVSQGSHRVLCIGPTDWLLFGSEDAEETLASMQRAAADCSLSFVDMSQGLSRHTLGGQHARDILSKGCGVDFHERAFGAEQCTRTRIAHMPVIVDCSSNEPRFECYVSRSYASHFTSWLRDASIEFQQ